MKIEDSDFFHAISVMLNNKVNSNLKRKIKEFELQLTEILTEQEKALMDKKISSFTEKYSKPIKVNLRSYQVKKQRVKRNININNRCIARTGLNKQCSRSRLNDSEYCKSHNIKKLPYGRIDEPYTQKIKKRKGVTKYDINDVDITKYIKTISIEIGGKEFLIDENNIIFTNDQVNNIVGRKVDDDVEWYDNMHR